MIEDHGFILSNVSVAIIKNKGDDREVLCHSIISVEGDGSGIEMIICADIVFLFLWFSLCENTMHHPD